MVSEEQFVSWLRLALRHLYEPTVLEGHPLIQHLGLAESANPAAALRRLITGAIRSMEPAEDLSPDARPWRDYEVLLYRYVQHCSQLEVADQLGISVRHLRREERRAMEALACVLHDLCAKAEIVAPFSDQPSITASDDARPAASDNAIEHELAWMARSADPTAELTETLDAVQRLLLPLAERHDVTLRMAPLEPVSLAVHPMALRQILVGLLSMAIRRAAGEAVDVAVDQLGWQVMLRIAYLDRSGETERESLEMAQRLATLAGGQVHSHRDGGHTLIHVDLPALEQLPVLVIEDNRDMISLLRRYASGTRYRVSGVRDMAAALAAAEQQPPQIVVLDVVMPDVDGWEALGRLRQHPLTAHVPVVVCTILPEEELALSLGASGYVRKPLTRDDFLRALDQACPQAPVSP